MNCTKNHENIETESTKLEIIISEMQPGNNNITDYPYFTKKNLNSI